MKSSHWWCWCTLYYISTSLLLAVCCAEVIPGPPVNLSSPRQTYNSVELEWGEPNIGYYDDDNASNASSNVVEYNYIISFSPPTAAVNSSCFRNNTCITQDTRYNVTGLQFGTRYSFVVYANSSTGIKSKPSNELLVLVPGKVPPSVSMVRLCLRQRKQTQLLINSVPCPLIISDSATTPPVTDYKVSVTMMKSAMMKSHILCQFGHVVNVTEGMLYSVGITAYNAVGGSTTAIHENFDTSWISNISVEHINKTLIVHYRTAPCVISHQSMKVQLQLSAGHLSSMNYVPNENKEFTINDLEKTAPLTLTLQVVHKLDNNPIGRKHEVEVYPAGRSTLPPVTKPPTESVPSEQLSIYHLRLIIGLVAGSVLSLIVIVITSFFVIKTLRKKIKFKVGGDEEFEFRTPKKDSCDPSTSRSLSASLSDDIYDTLEIHKQNPYSSWVPDYEEVVTNASML